MMSYSEEELEIQALVSQQYYSEINTLINYKFLLVQLSLHGQIKRASNIDVKLEYIQHFKK